MNNWNKLTNILLEKNHIKIPIEKRFFLSFLEDDENHINKHKVLNEILKLGFLDDDPRLIELKNNFNLAKLHEMKFSEEVDLFHNAECVVGLHGGGFANIVFCRPKTKIIELKSLTAGDAIKNLAIKNDLDYTSVATEAKQIYKFTNG